MRGIKSNRPVFLLVLLAVLILLGGAGWVGSRHLWAQRHFQSAQAAADRRAFAKALEHLAVCRRLWPDSGAVHFLAARTARIAQGVVGSHPGRSAAGCRGTQADDFECSSAHHHWKKT